MNSFTLNKNQLKIFSTYIVCQLLVVVFVPSVLISKYNIFISDLLSISAAMFMYLAFIKNKFIVSRTEVLIIILFFISFLAGMVRPPIAVDLNWALTKLDGFTLYTNEDFSFFRELYHCIRYISWFSLVVMIFKIIHSNKDKLIQYYNQLSRIIYLLICSIALLHWLEFFYPPSQEFFAAVYGYNIKFTPWMNRYFAMFQSPLESAMMVSLSSILILSSPLIKYYEKYILVLATLSVLYLTRTFTPVIGMTGMLLYFILCKYGKIKSLLLGIIFFVAIVLIFYFAKDKYPQVWLKVVNMAWRFEYWSAYLGIMKKSIFTSLFGFGYISIHADSSYLFFLLHGGLVLFISFWYYMFEKVKIFWNKLNIVQRGVIIFLAISGLTLDLIIYRHVVVLMFCYLPFYFNFNQNIIIQKKL